MTKPRKSDKLTKAERRLAGRIKDYEQIKQDHNGEFHKPGSLKKNK